MARGHVRPSVRYRRGRHPPVHRLAQGRSGADHGRRRRRIAAGSLRHCLDRPAPLFQRACDAVPQSLPDAGEVTGEPGGRASLRPPSDRGAARSACVPLVRAAAPVCRRLLPEVHAEGTDRAACWRAARPVRPRLTAPVPADIRGRGRGTCAAEAAAVHGRRHPLGQGGRSRWHAARLPDGATRRCAGARFLASPARRGRSDQGTPDVGDRHGHHCHASRGDGPQTPGPVGGVLRPPPGRLDDQPGIARQRSSPWPDAPDHRRVPPPDRATRGGGGHARLDQPQTCALHADPGAAGDSRFVDLLAACLSATLPALGRHQQADDDALRHALRHPCGEGLCPGVA